MQRDGRLRRLDDRADLLLRRRVGRGLFGPELSRGQHVLLAVVTSLVVAGVLAVALVASGQAGRVPTLLGPVVGVVLGTLVGRAVRDARRRR